MSVSVEKLENSMAKLTIEVSAEDFDKAVEQVFRKNRNRFNIPGFRKGKAPRKFIEQMYGPQVFYDDAINDSINKSYPGAVEECGEEIVSSPEISIEKAAPGEPLVYTALVALKPPVSLGKYKGVSVPAQDTEVTPEEVEAEIKRELEKNASIEEVTDRPVQNGDEIRLDFEGFVDGVAFEGGKGEDYPLTIGSGSFIPGFEEQLIGVSVGEDKEVNVTFPEDYNAAELAGKAAVFKCAVRKIQEKVLPELNDEYAEDHTEFDTLEEYRADVLKTLKERKEAQAKNQKQTEVIAAIVADSEIQLPEPMVKTQQRQMVDEQAQRFQQMGLTLDQYFQYTGTNMDKMMEDMKEQAEKNIRTRLVLEQIAKEENLSASEEDFEEEIRRQAEAYSMEADDVRKFFTDSAKVRLMEDLAVQKALDLVTDLAVETAPAAKKAEEA